MRRRLLASAVWRIRGETLRAFAPVRIITLSSIPPRFDLIGPTLESLTAQSSPVDAVELHVPRSYRRFPDYDGRCPKVPAGVSILEAESDLGPASKVLHAVRRHRDDRVESNVVRLQSFGDDTDDDLVDFFLYVHGTLH